MIHKAFITVYNFQILCYRIKIYYTIKECQLYMNLYFLKNNLSNLHLENQMHWCEFITFIFSHG